MSPTADPIYLFEDHDKLGFIDQTGNVIFRTDRSNIWPKLHIEFHDGLLLLGNYPHAEFMDLHGRTVKFENVDQAGDFSEGLAPALDRNSQKWGFINTKGEFVIPPTYQRWYVPFLDSFSDDLALISLHGKYGFVDPTGALAIDAKFLRADSFHNGLARVIIDGPCTTHSEPCASLVGSLVIGNNSGKRVTAPPCRYAFIDKSGRPTSDQRFDDAKDFSEGLAPVRIEGKWGYIDKTGELVVSPQFDTAEVFSDGVALVSRDKLFGYVGHDGAYTIKPLFKYAEHFVDGLALVGAVGQFTTDSSFWYIDHTGRRAIPDSFLLATSFFKGRAHVKISAEPGEYSANLWSGKFAYIDRIGRKVFTYEVKTK